jgi:hypothetical protein
VRGVVVFVVVAAAAAVTAAAYVVILGVVVENVVLVVLEGTFHRGKVLTHFLRGFITHAACFNGIGIYNF